MSKTTTADRLKEIMQERHLRQTDVVAICQPLCDKYGVKIGRNDLSQYISGKYVPRQKKLAILASALNVDEAWLMGYDVDPKPSWLKQSELSNEECDIVSELRSLDEEGLKRVKEYVDMLNASGNYQKGRGSDG